MATMITDRAVLGIHTNLIKVKAHTGIVGNEIADKAANEAAESQTGHMVTVGADPYESMHWLASSNGTSKGTPACATWTTSQVKKGNMTHTRT
eukprot:jgi/Chrzof1/10106/Cz04g27080.t1